MATAENLPPAIYHANDPDGIFALWQKLVQEFMDGERVFGKNFLKIFDPDSAPAIFVELMLRNLGNPFNKVFLTLTQKRKLVKLLMRMYRQKGTARGIINAVRFLTGIIVDIIDPHGVDEDSWRVGESEIGLNTFVGGSRVYCNMLDWTEDLDNAVWTKAGGTNVVPDDVNGPLPWVRMADRLIMNGAGAEIYQEVTPYFVGDETFTASVWLKADAPSVITLSIEAKDTPTDKTAVDLNITTEWQRFDIMHTMDPVEVSTEVIFRLKTAAGIPNNIYAWGTQLVRNDEIQPYAQSTDNGEDCSYPGKWAYHFFIVTEVELTENEEMIIRLVADYMKPAHTHYTLVFPGNDQIPNVFNHWLIGLSQIGVNTYVHP